MNSPSRLLGGWFSRALNLNSTEPLHAGGADSTLPVHSADPRPTLCEQTTDYVQPVSRLQHTSAE